MKRLIIAFVALAVMVPSLAPASITDIATTNEGDGTWYRNNWYAGSYSGFNEGGDLGTVYYFFGGADRYFERSYMQFDLSIFGGSVADIQSVSFNYNLIGTEGSGTIGTIRHASNSSSATGLASQLIAGNEIIETVSGGMAAGWHSVDVTSMLMNDFTQGYSYSAFSTSYSSNWDLSFTMGSSESNLAPYLRIVTSAGVPVPASIVLMLTGLLGLVGLGRKQEL